LLLCFDERQQHKQKLTTKLWQKSRIQKLLKEEKASFTLRITWNTRVRKRSLNQVLSTEAQKYEHRLWKDNKAEAALADDDDEDETSENNETEEVSERDYVCSRPFVTPLNCRVAEGGRGEMQVTTMTNSTVKRTKFCNTSKECFLTGTAPRKLLVSSGKG
jgi:arsenate reductase-like glutaredoxin family protein